MAFEEMRPAVGYEYGMSRVSGVSMGVQVRSGQRRLVRIGLTLEAQKRFFGVPLAGKFCWVLLGTGEDEGFLAIQQGGNIPVTINKSEAVAIHVDPWPGVPQEAQKSRDVHAVNDTARGLLLVHLPPWALPATSPQAPAFPASPAQDGPAREWDDMEGVWGTPPTTPHPAPPTTPSGEAGE